MANSERYGAVVIGAGMGGLATAALLARQGLRPLVVDRADVVGGRGKARPYRGYNLPVAVRIYAKRAIDDLLDRLQLSCEFAPIHSPLLAFYLTRRRRYLPLPDDFPESHAEFLGAMGMGRARARELGAELATWLRIPAREIKRMIRAGTSFDAFLAGRVRDPTLRRLLFNITTWVGHGIGDARRLSAGQFLEKFVYPITQGEAAGYAGVPTDQALLDELAEYVGKHGGEVRLRTEAVRVECARRRITGVVLRNLDFESYEHVQASTAVFAAPVWQLPALVDTRLLTPRWLDAARKRPAHEAAMIAVWYGLKRKVSEISSWIRFLTPDSATRTQTRYGGGGMFLSNISPGVAPPGKQLFVAETMVEGSLRRDWRAIEKHTEQVRRWARGLFVELRDRGHGTAILDDVLEWEKPCLYWPAWGASHYSVLPMPGVKVPGVSGLYAAGDTVESARMGFDSAAASGICCAETILAKGR